jgi:hypothetical protein
MPFNKNKQHRRLSTTHVDDTSMVSSIVQHVKLKIIQYLGGTDNLDSLFLFFQAQDSDGSAGLDPQEFQDALASCDLVLSSVEVRSLFTSLGVEEDGELDINRFLMLMKAEGKKGKLARFNAQAKKMTMMGHSSTAVQTIVHREDAIKKIQSLFRGAIARVNYRNYRGAARIQSLFRMVIAQNHFEDKVKEYNIQRMMFQRQYNARKIQALARPFVRRTMREKEANVQEMTSRALEPLQLQIREKVQTKNDSARQMQSVVRGRQARKTIVGIRSEHEEREKMLARQRQQMLEVAQLLAVRVARDAVRAVQLVVSLTQQAVELALQRRPSKEVKEQQVVDTINAKIGAAMVANTAATAANTVVSQCEREVYRRTSPQSRPPTGEAKPTGLSVQVTVNSRVAGVTTSTCKRPMYVKSQVRRTPKPAVLPLQHAAVERIEWLAAQPAPYPPNQLKASEQVSVASKGMPVRKVVEVPVVEGGARSASRGLPERLTREVGKERRTPAATSVYADKATAVATVNVPEGAPDWYVARVRLLRGAQKQQSERSAVDADSKFNEQELGNQRRPGTNCSSNSQGRAYTQYKEHLKVTEQQKKIAGARKRSFYGQRAKQAAEFDAEKHGLGSAAGLPHPRLLVETSVPGPSKGGNSAKTTSTSTSNTHTAHTCAHTFQPSTAPANSNTARINTAEMGERQIKTATGNAGRKGGLTQVQLAFYAGGKKIRAHPTHGKRYTERCVATRERAQLQRRGQTQHAKSAFVRLKQQQQQAQDQFESKRREYDEKLHGPEAQAQDEDVGNGYFAGDSARPSRLPSRSSHTNHSWDGLFTSCGTHHFDSASQQPSRQNRRQKKVRPLSPSRADSSDSDREGECHDELHPSFVRFPPTSHFGKLHTANAAISKRRADEVSAALAVDNSSVWGSMQESMLDIGYMGDGCPSCDTGLILPVVGHTFTGQDQERHVQKEYQQRRQQNQQQQRQGELHQKQMRRKQQLQQQQLHRQEQKADTARRSFSPLESGDRRWSSVVQLPDGHGQNSSLLQLHATSPPSVIPVPPMPPSSEIRRDEDEAIATSAPEKLVPSRPAAEGGCVDRTESGNRGARRTFQPPINY